MRTRQTQGRALFLTYICGSYVAILLAAPLVNSFASASAGASRLGYPAFERLDRDKDGFIDKPEAAALRGLLASFERADANRDGRLDKVEYARALALLDANK